MPKVYTVDGTDVSPPLTWRGVPEGTKEFALIMDDPDARGFVHWLIYKIPANVDTLPENLPRDAVIAQPLTALQGTSSFKVVGYRGPAARKGGGVHNYHFTLYALSEPLDVQPGLNKPALLEAMAGRVIDKTELIGKNER